MLAVEAVGIGDEMDRLRPALGQAGHLICRVPARPQADGDDEAGISRLQGRLVGERFGSGRYLDEPDSVKERIDGRPLLIEVEERLVEVRLIIRIPLGGAYHSEGAAPGAPLRGWPG